MASASKFSLQYHYLIEKTGYENKGKWSPKKKGLDVYSNSLKWHHKKISRLIRRI